jgi:hypothetical protein
MKNTDCGFGVCERSPECTNRCAYRMGNWGATKTPPERQSTQQKHESENKEAIADIAIAILIVALCAGAAMSLANKIWG